MKMAQYLASSEYINWQHPAVLEKAHELSKGLSASSAAEEITGRCFEFVRDKVQHSWDYQRNPLTCKASDVLAHRTGFCYAKSHLLAALLRANNIPAGLCYQRLTITNTPPFCLHGLNAVYLESIGWYRLDARGNKPGVNAEFCPPTEKLAFPIVTEGEADLPEIWAEPLPIVVQALTQHKTIEEASDNLPDLPLIT